MVKSTAALNEVAGMGKGWLVTEATQSAYSDAKLWQKNGKRGKHTVKNIKNMNISAI